MPGLFERISAFVRFLYYLYWWILCLCMCLRYLHDIFSLSVYPCQLLRLWIRLNFRALHSNEIRRKTTNENLANLAYTKTAPQKPGTNSKIALALLLECLSYRIQWGPLLVAQWLRYCATNRKVAGSIPDGVIGIFHWYNPSDRTMALGSTQPLKEMSTTSISWG
jgi:hypothetical protein